MVKSKTCVFILSGHHLFHQFVETTGKVAGILDFSLVGLLRDGFVELGRV